MGEVPRPLDLCWSIVFVLDTSEHPSERTARRQSKVANALGLSPTSRPISHRCVWMGYSTDLFLDHDQAEAFTCSICQEVWSFLALLRLV